MCQYAGQAEGRSGVVLSITNSLSPRDSLKKKRKRNRHSPVGKSGLWTKQRRIKMSSMPIAQSPQFPSIKNYARRSHGAENSCFTCRFEWSSRRRRLSGALGRAQFCRTRPRVGGDLACRRLLGDLAHELPGAQGVAASVLLQDAVQGPGPQDALHSAVFERMVTQHYDAA